ncbi:MAG: hypothetical protein ACRDWY_15315 [Actinomycetes bacterium]
MAMPVLEGALERSIDLAAAMDARGFGRGAGPDAAAHASGHTSGQMSGHTSAAHSSRHTSGALTLAGLLGVCAGLYGLLDAGSPVALGLPLLAAGALVAGAGLAVGGRRAIRSRYRPDRWGRPEWIVAGSGAVAAAAAIVGSALDPAAMHPATSPLTVPTLPVLPVLGLLVALLPAWASPRPEPEEDHRVAVEGAA